MFGKQVGFSFKFENEDIGRNGFFSHTIRVVSTTNSRICFLTCRVINFSKESVSSGNLFRLVYLLPTMGSSVESRWIVDSIGSEILKHHNKFPNHTILIDEDFSVSK